MFTPTHHDGFRVITRKDGKGVGLGTSVDRPRTALSSSALNEDRGGDRH